MFVIERVRVRDRREVLQRAAASLQDANVLVLFDGVARPPGERIWVARRGWNGPIVGFVAARPAGAGDAELFFSVRPEVVGRGVRRGLLRDLEWTLARDGIRSVTVQVEERDRKGIELYESMGFEPSGALRSEAGTRVRLVRYLTPAASGSGRRRTRPRGILLERPWMTGP